jgi:hypothetical protein
MNLHGVPVQDRIGDQAQAARLVHDFFVISCGEFALIREPVQHVQSFPRGLQEITLVLKTEYWSETWL